MLDLDALRSLKSDTEARRPAKLLLLLLSASLLGMCANAGLPRRTETERMPPSASAKLAVANSDVLPLLTMLERRRSCAMATPRPRDVRGILGSANDVDGSKSYAAFT
jgi:hypothetical protein